MDQLSASVASQPLFEGMARLGESAAAVAPTSIRAPFWKISNDVWLRWTEDTGLERSLVCEVLDLGLEELEGSQVLTTYGPELVPLSSPLEYRETLSGPVDRQGLVLVVIFSSVPCPALDLLQSRGLL